MIIVGAIALALVIGLIRKRARVRRIPHPAPVDPETARIQWQQRAAVEREARRPQRLQQLERLAFPYELVPGAQAEAAYEAAWIAGAAEGFSPLIITPDSLPLPSFSCERSQTAAQQILAAALPAKEFFTQREAALFRDDENDDIRRHLDEAKAFALAEPLSELPRLDERMWTLQDTKGHNPPFPWIEQAALVRVPTPRSWEIPAYTLYGGWNGSPDPTEMVAVARHWHEAYGADICGMGEQTLEFRVARPPADQRAALALIREHILFCDEGLFDLIGTPATFRDVVAQLQRQRYWLFWWD